MKNIYLTGPSSSTLFQAGLFATSEQSCSPGRLSLPELLLPICGHECCSPIGCQRPKGGNRVASAALQSSRLSAECKAHGRCWGGADWGEMVLTGHPQLPLPWCVCATLYHTSRLLLNVPAERSSNTSTRAGVSDLLYRTPR